MTKVEEVREIIRKGKVSNSASVTITRNDANKICAIVSDLFESRMRWIDSAMSWHEAVGSGSPQPGSAFTLEESARKLSFEFFSEIKSGQKTFPDLCEELATRVQGFGCAKVREAGRFWGFHLGFLRTSIEAGRNRDEILTRIDDLHEAMTGHRREA